jgi:hypothetical protein
LATEVYELDKPIGHSFGDVEYYLRRLAGISGRILEPAVGTGRILMVSIRPLRCSPFAGNTVGIATWSRIFGKET